MLPGEVPRDYQGLLETEGMKGSRSGLLLKCTLGGKVLIRRIEQTMSLVSLNKRVCLKSYLRRFI